ARASTGPAIEIAGESAHSVSSKAKAYEASTGPAIEIAGELVGGGRRERAARRASTGPAIEIAGEPHNVRFVTALSRCFNGAGDRDRRRVMGGSRRMVLHASLQRGRRSRSPERCAPPRRGAPRSPRFNGAGDRDRRRERSKPFGVLIRHKLQ